MVKVLCDGARLNDSNDVQDERNKMKPKILLHTTPSGGLSLTIPRQEIESFKTAISRACNTWQDIPPEIDELNQKLVYGRVLQAPALKIPVLNNSSECPICGVPEGSHHKPDCGWNLTR